MTGNHGDTEDTEKNSILIHETHETHENKKNTKTRQKSKQRLLNCPVSCHLFPLRYLYA